MEHHNQNSVSVKKQGSKKQGHFYSKREEARPERIHNPITEMGFPTMFTFQLDKTKRKTLPAPYCRNGSCRARLLLLFLNNNDPVFLHPAFCIPYVRPFFLCSIPWKNIRPTWSSRIGCADWLGNSFPWQDLTHILRYQSPTETLLLRIF